MTSSPNLDRIPGVLAGVLGRERGPVGDFAGPPPPETGGAASVFPLSTFSLRDMSQCGVAIRRMGTTAKSKSSVANDVAQFLYDRMRNDSGQRAFALVRCFETCGWSELDEDQRAASSSFREQVSADTTCMTLVATVGDEPEWNDTTKSVGHCAIPLPSVRAIEQLPMVSQLIKQLGLDIGGILKPDVGLMLKNSSTKVFHVPEASESTCIPAQEEFVIPFGIRSVVGFGDLLPDGHLFAVIMFSKIPISREVAALFSHLSLSVKMAFLPFVKSANAFESELLDVRRLLQNYEEIVAQQESRLHAALEDLSRSNADLEQFAYAVSHDLQEPLRAVSGFCQLLKKGYHDQLDVTAQQFIDDAVDGSRRMQQVIKDLLAYSRIGRLSDPAEPVDCSVTAGQALKALRVQVDQSQAKVHYDGLPTVLGYAGPLLELFQNLVGNALKYRGDDSPEVHITAEASGDQWRFCVRDNGIGIDPKDAERIFVVFQRLHTREAYPGTGIGLAICKRIVERHGGSIWVEAKLNEGCAFFFTIPRNKGR